VQDCTRYLLPVQDMGGSSNAESVRIECLPVCVKKGVVTGTQLCPVWIQIPVPVPGNKSTRHEEIHMAVWYLVHTCSSSPPAGGMEPGTPLVPANCDLRVYSKGDAEKTQAGKNS